MSKMRPEWPDGPWDDEPDHLEFEADGFPAILHRQPHGGYWCGYVAVPPGHPAHGKDMLDLCDLEVHGGITYAEPCQGVICHVPKPGEPDNVYWLGFDCSHSYDVSPSRNWTFGSPLSSYRSAEYVRRQAEQLARQLKAMAP